MQPLDDRPLIRASELTQYSFCHRAWWLRTVKGYRPASQVALVRGRTEHQHHARQVQAALRWRRAGFLLMSTAFFFFVIILFWFFV